MPDLQTQIRGLRTDMGIFSTEAQGLRTDMEAADHKSKNRLALAVASMFVGLVGIAVGGIAYLAIRSANVDGVAFRRSACIQSNAQRAEVRDALTFSLQAIAPVEAQRTDQQRAALALYQGAVEQALPYRDCTPAGLAAYYRHPPEDPATK